ncbi:hypothetical protein ACQPX6_06045 [Actinomycetospora sp. CA-101289]|uniref:hypothetical protein n=1 Tax=Actinomycetospora sp. CA-101289 TaxID=3239893 RepID=UPI003D96A672
MDAGPREPVATAPVFVDVSGRRRRGIAVLGYLGASACTAYLAAFGITVSTTAGTIPASGVALDPGPVVDEGAEEAGGETVAVADTVVPAPTAGKHAAATRPARHAHPTTEPARGRHAAAEEDATPTRRHTARTLPLAATTRTPSTPTATPAPAGTGTPRPTPDTTPATGGPGGSSSGGAGPTTGTGTDDDTGSDAGTDTGTDDPGTGTVSDPATSDVLAIGPVSIGLGV